MPPCGQCNSGTAETASVLYLTHPVLSSPFLRFLKNFPAAACGRQTLNAQREVAIRAGGIQFKVPTGLSINQTQPDVPQSPPCGFLQNCPGHRREAIDKALKMGYSKDTKGAASRRLPLHHREVTVILEEWRLLLFVILENQSNDSQNDHAELKQFTP